jgi:hypothetical protein
MAATRYNHFGSSVTLPDASYAVFFLCGLFLGRIRGALVLLVLLLLEAALIDYYAINFRGMNGSCVTLAYSFLVFAYGALWFLGRTYALRYDLSVNGLLGLFASAAIAGSAAFMIANASFYLLAGYFSSMSIAEYIGRVSQYYSSYVAITVLYVGLAACIQLLSALLAGKISQEKDLA